MPSSSEPTPPNHPNVWLICLYSFVLAALIRWPCIPYIHAAPLDANFGLHALSAAHFTSFDLFAIDSVAYPDGISARFIAIPVLLLTKALSLLWSPVAATNLAIWIWVAVQGMGSALLFPSRGRATQMLIASIAMLSPLSILALGNGQWENVATFPILLAIVSLQRQRWIACGGGFVLCAFCSPYILLTALMCAVPFCWSHRGSVSLYACLATPLLFTWLYYSDANTNQSAHIGPAPATLPEPALLNGLLFPVNHAEHGGISLPSPAERIRSISDRPTKQVYDDEWPWKMSTAGSYLGLVIFGLTVRRLWKQPNVPIIIGIILCVLLSLGSYLSVFGMHFALPWVLTAETPLSKMAATYRFLAGFSVLSILCVQATSWSRNVSGVLIAALLLDGLLCSPSHWPLSAIEAVPSEVLKEVDQDTAVAFWPAAPVMSPHKITMAALVLNKPVALFEDVNAQMPNADGTLSRNKRPLNASGESPDAWKQRMTTVGVRHLVQFRHLTGSKSHPFHQQSSTCDEAFCRISLLPVKTNEQ